MRRIAVLIVAAAVIIVLVVAQLVLPGVAAQRLRDRLQQSGRVLAVQVDAFPAIELLWHHADRVVVRMASYTSNPGNLGSLLAQAGDVGTLDARAAEFNTGLLTLRDASLSKRGDQLIGSAQVTEADLRAALPILQSLTPVASDAGGLTLQGTAALLGVTASVDAIVRAQDGAVVVAPAVPFGSLATITVFSNPDLEIQSIGASVQAGGFSVFGRARLR
jgi:hypothetical protein